MSNDDPLNSSTPTSVNNKFIALTDEAKNIPAHSPDNNKMLLNNTTSNEHYAHSTLKRRCDEQCFQRLLSLDNYLNRFERILGPQNLDKVDTHDSCCPSQGDNNAQIDFDFSKIGPRRLPIQNILTTPIHTKMNSDEPQKDIDELVHLYKLQCNQQRQILKATRNVDTFKNFSTGIMTNEDSFDESALTISPTSLKFTKHGKQGIKKITAPITSSITENSLSNASSNLIISKEKKGDNEFVPEISRKRRKKHFLGTDGCLLLQCDTDSVRFRFYCDVISKAIPKAQRSRNSARINIINLKRKLANNFNKYKRRCYNLSKKSERDFLIRTKKSFREVSNFGKRSAKAAHSNKKKREQEIVETQKQQQQYKDMKRQQRKLNYLITQTELFSHFMGLQNSQDSPSAGVDVNDDELAKILSILDEGDNATTAESNSTSNAKSTKTTTTTTTTNTEANVDNDQYDIDEAKTSAMESIRKAVEKQNIRLSQYQNNSNQSNNNANIISTEEYFQKENIIFNGTLKGYQLKGVSWLSNLYDKGFNGILADEMGLGKTVQTMSFLAYLAETRNLWGPFLIISPSSTLHNWQQEFNKFAPQFNVLPYWGTGNERKLLRSFWNSKKKFLQSKDGAPFHVLITSYQLVVRDVQFFTKLNWQYMVLDEAQAIKSSNSQRWKKLLSFKCRNRLLLTGTPMQNTMAELWSLLHFIMPVLFDSHEEFNEWFSKDIEGRVENKAEVDETHLSRLHMILQPFMLRRTKKEVEKELTDKIEILVNCGLSLRQKFLYQIIKEKLSSKDIMDAMSRKIGSANKTAMINSYKELMNLVVQFRKVCNHPDLFESRDLCSPLHVEPIEYPLPNLFLGSRNLFQLPTSIRNLFNVHSAENLVQSFFDNQHSNCGALYFSRISPDTLDKCFSSILYQLQYYLYQVMAYQSQLCCVDSTDVNDETIPFITSPSSGSRNSLINLMIWPKFKLSAVQLMSSFSDIVNSLAFIRNDTNINTYGIVKINPVCTFSNMNNNGDDESPPSIDMCTMEANNNIINDSFKTYPNIILSAFCKKVTTAPPQIKMISKRATVNQSNLKLIDKENEQFLFHGHCDKSPKPRTSSGLQLMVPHHNHWSHNPRIGFNAICPPQGWSNLIKSDPSELIVDSDKLLVLHSLLSRLKSQGHRVLIYSQMTKMIDILENYLIQVKHKYVRLDGSSKMADRRETVSDFQTNADIFVFLLSTRAGGIGINLTAADTVIFYDSDWNPTVDQQAMDRAHRLGQTRQVTVYRMICIGTVEERILQTANQKSLVQKMIISGKDINKSLKPKEIVALLLDEDELQQRMKARKDTNVNERRKNKTTTNKVPTIKSLAGTIKKTKRKNVSKPNSPKKKTKVT